MKVDKELLKGSLEIVVLSVLKPGPLYGYQIAKEARRQSNEFFALGEGTLYTMLHKLEKAKLLEAYWEEVEGRRRKYYALTKTGRKKLDEKTAEWRAYAQAMHQVI